MSKNTRYTVITPLPAGITRETVRDTLHNHVEMIDLNPLVIDRFRIPKPPARASAEEYHCAWYQLQDKVSYLPGGMASGKVEYFACFHDLADGIQTHVLAPLGLDIKEKWTVGGTLPGELRGPTELGLGIPKDGLYLREDVDMRCNIMLTSFVKKNLRNAHGVLVDRLLEKSHLLEREAYNSKLLSQSGSSGEPSLSSEYSARGSMGRHQSWTGAPSERASTASGTTESTRGKATERAPVELGSDPIVHEMAG
ncbi:hypothetical protein FH972_021877 [Carpinus fangiana]|uniref:DUF7053 domain-containing protein n=1 Tax=Carpinus fangiana TaxID=176857 RepID=A0A5N6KQZ2_9ROSI|nr:hypothetical protein FH972_021877 [Carpinus fangiana]